MNTSLADIMGSSHEARSSSGCICIHVAVADQMAAEGWLDPRVPVQMRIVEHCRRHEAILARQIKCPAWDTCPDRMKTEQRRANPDMAAWEDAFRPPVPVGSAPGPLAQGQRGQVQPVGEGKRAKRPDCPAPQGAQVVTQKTQITNKSSSGRSL